MRPSIRSGTVGTLEPKRQDLKLGATDFIDDISLEPRTGPKQARNDRPQPRSTTKQPRGVAAPLADDRDEEEEAEDASLYANANIPKGPSEEKGKKTKQKDKAPVFSLDRGGGLRRGQAAHLDDRSVNHLKRESEPGNGSFKRFKGGSFKGGSWRP